MSISATTPPPAAASRKVPCARRNGSRAKRASTISRTCGGSCRYALQINSALAFRVSLYPYSRYLICMQLRGCGTALVTPFRQDGSIDDAALRHLVAWQVASGIDFLVPCGTTGETPTLTHDELLYVIDTTIEIAAGRVPIVAGATSNSTHDAVEKAKEIGARPGVNAILTASPYYNKPTQEGQYRHFQAIRSE